METGCCQIPKLNLKVYVKDKILSWVDFQLIVLLSLRKLVSNGHKVFFSKYPVKLREQNFIISEKKINKQLAKTMK